MMQPGYAEILLWKEKYQNPFVSRAFVPVICPTDYGDVPLPVKKHSYELTGY